MKIKGTPASDMLRGTEGNDTIRGYAGDDTIMGGGGLDIMKGGKGADTFVVNTDQFALIRDFKPGKDTIVFVDGITDTGAGVRPIDQSEFGSLVTFANGVLEYDGQPVVAVGDVAVSYDDLFLN